MSERIKKSSVTIGGDPELFLVDKEGNAVSAIGKVPGSKEEPFVLEHLGEGFAIQTDCCSVEFNLPPVNFIEHHHEVSAARFKTNVDAMLCYIRSIIPAGLDLSFKTSIEFSDEDLEHPQAREAGCSVDYNAWELCPNEKPDFVSTNVRCNGAHLHFGYNDPTDLTSIELIKALDLTLGITSVVIDQDKERRKLYGKAGCFRMTSFGIEYRVPSPYYLANEELVKHVFRAIDKAIDLVNEGKEYSDIEQLDIQTCINISDAEMAYELIKKYKLESILPVGILVA